MHHKATGVFTKLSVEFQNEDIGANLAFLIAHQPWRLPLETPVFLRSDFLNLIKRRSQLVSIVLVMRIELFTSDAVHRSALAHTYCSHATRSKYQLWRFYDSSLTLLGFRDGGARKQGSHAAFVLYILPSIREPTLVIMTIRNQREIEAWVCILPGVFGTGLGIAATSDEA